MIETKSLQEADLAPEVAQRKREVTAYVSAFGNLDRVGDIVHPGSFQRTLSDGGRFDRGLVSVKYNHTMLVGKPLRAVEDDYGLLTVQKFASDKESDRVFNLIADHVLTTFSMKYRVADGGFYYEPPRGRERTRHITDVELYEFGPVDPDLVANEEARLVAVKAAMDEAEGMGSELGVDLTPENWQAIIALIQAAVPVAELVQAIAEKQEPAEDAEPSEGKGFNNEAAALLALGRALDRRSDVFRKILNQ